MEHQDLIFQLAETLGWTASPYGQWMILSHPGKRDVYCSETRHWLVFECPIAAGPQIRATAPEHRREVFRSLLELNRSMYMAKFLLDDAEHLILTSEVPRACLSLTLATWAFRAITYYADAYGAQIVDFVRHPGPLSFAAPDDTVEIIPMPLTDRHRGQQFALAPTRMAGISRSQFDVWLKALQSEGWIASPADDPYDQTRKLQLRRKYQRYLFYTTSTTSWLYFQGWLATITPGVQARAGHCLQVLRYLLRLNDVVSGAKLGLDRIERPGDDPAFSDDVFLLQELPIQMIDFVLFRQATRSLNQCIADHLDEIRLMCALDHDAQLAEWSWQGQM